MPEAGPLLIFSPIPLTRKGRSFVIHKLPIPKHPICITEEDLLGYDFEAGEDQREAGERLAASYINFYLANHCVLLPRFWR